MSNLKEIEQKQKFYDEITSAVDVNDVDKFENLLNSQDFCNYNKVEKEKTAFRVAYVGSEACLDYLIFDYRIEQHDTILAFCNMNPIIKKKFEMSEIAKGLTINTNTFKKLKM